MNTKFHISFLLVCTITVATGCVKIQLKPEKLASDTVSAGKSLYETIKRRKDGTEERIYSHTVVLDAEIDLRELSTQCLTHLKSIAQSATDNDMKVLEESTEVLNLDSGERLKCTLRAVV